MLSAEAKLVWMEDWTLDRGGEGCWLSHADLGVRVGMSADAVQYHRTRLVEVGLYERIKRPGARTPGWRPTLPADIPRIPSQRPSPAEVAKVRTFLDLHLRGKPVAATVSDRDFHGLEPRRSRSQTGAVPVSRLVSTAFDSQAVQQPSTALGVEGNRDSSHEQKPKAVEGIDRDTLPQSGLPQIPVSGSESEIELEPRPIDQRPRKAVEDEGWERLREKLAAKKRQAGTA